MFWIAGGVPTARATSVLWLIGLAIDYGGPRDVLGAGDEARVPPSAWEVEVSHFAERFQLFVILALGESIVVTGATASGEALDAARLSAFAVAFLGTAAMWWVYFNDAAASRAAPAGAGHQPHPARPRRLHLPARPDGRGGDRRPRSATSS